MKYDDSQSKVISINGGRHLVLAPPGCGKTQILTERIRVAHDKYGVGYDEMICLTFTNRAARGMAERIRQELTVAGTPGEVGVEAVFVGNVHRYCIRMLTEEGIVPQSYAIIDDDDALSIMARFMELDEARLLSDYTKTKECFEVIHLSQLMYQIMHGQPKEVRLHPESLDAKDLQSFRIICQTFGKNFTADVMEDIYCHADTYINALDDMQVFASANSGAYRQQVLNTLRKMSLARSYEKYKRDNNLMDFNEILILTYNALRDGSEEMLKRVRRRWVQVDEVQDLNPLQMAIVDMLTDTTGDYTVVYLGDEQQAIFSFMGAKLSQITQLNERCDGIHHLSRNHRSPKYLLDIFNIYAEKVMGIKREFLPQASNNEYNVGATQIIYGDTMEDECKFVVSEAGDLLRMNPGESTAIIVLSNADAEMISGQLDEFHLPHFKISGVDLFSTPEMKLLLAHFTAVASDTNLLAWSRLFLHCKSVSTPFEARSLVRQLLHTAIAPAELLSPDQPLMTQRFVTAYEQSDIVIFDTETTGLDVLRDDIIQIAAMRIRQGEVVDKFVVHVETNREIPLMLGDIVNPIIEERKTNEILSHEEALTAFMRFADGAVLLAHNADFDIHILDYNLRRYIGEKLPMDGVECFDSLRLIRLLEPDLRVYKLKYLLEVLHLEGNNSHLADDDVAATKSLVDYCYAKAKAIIPQQKALMEKKMMVDVGQRLLQNYAPLYEHTKKNMWVGNVKFADELKYIYDQLVTDSLIKEIKKLEYACDYLSDELIDYHSYPLLAQQLMKYGAEINTLKEADLCGSERIRERIFVSTVHKAKGLEFDNVIVFDCVDGRYPNFNSDTPQQKAEDARKLYVALSRAKKRLFIAVSHTFVNRYGRVFTRKISPFLTPILDRF